MNLDDANITPNKTREINHMKHMDDSVEASYPLARTLPPPVTIKKATPDKTMASPPPYEPTSKPPS